MKNAAPLSILIGFLGFLLDRGQKFYQIDILGWRGGERINITGFFDYVLVWNKGVSFGLLDSTNPIIKYFLIGLALLIIIVWWFKTTDMLTKFGLALCVGGAISNIIDRFLYGAVADFFHFYLGQYSFYIFNLADVLISLGVALLLLEMLIPKKLNRDNLNKDKI